MKEGYVYIISNAKRTVFYTGVTSDLISRIYQHKQGNGSFFSSKYNVFFLMYYETHQTMYHAIEREKQIKKWKREWKLNLIKSKNPEFEDLWNEILPKGRFHF
ncbi:MAG: GIY-YIG nuclease family protein [Balneola sp.]|nr:MAG: GIY-YIG nuclease family protein [Balneola sp.]